MTGLEWLDKQSGWKQFAIAAQCLILLPFILWFMAIEWVSEAQAARRG